MTPTSIARAPIARIPLDDRITTFPIARQKLWEHYNTMLKLFWTSDSYHAGHVDAHQYETTLTEGERTLVDHILAFFASSDNLICANLVERFSVEVDIPEARMFYNAQIANEDIHATTYSLMIETMVKDIQKKKRLFNALRDMPSVGRIIEFIQSATASQESFAVRLLRMVAAEGILFFGSFGAIFWLDSRGLLPGFCSVNKYVARDETLHALFAVELYSMIDEGEKLTVTQVHAIFREAVQLSMGFIEAAIPVPLVGLNVGSLTQYVQHQVDVILHHMKLPLLYKVENPFLFSQKLNMANKSNFFEVTPTDYSHFAKYSHNLFDDGSPMGDVSSHSSVSANDDDY